MAKIYERCGKTIVRFEIFINLIYNRGYFHHLLSDFGIEGFISDWV
jgi:hypothetical protein